jgi:hypothetical protein
MPQPLRYQAQQQLWACLYPHHLLCSGVMDVAQNVYIMLTAHFVDPLVRTEHCSVIVTVWTVEERHVLYHPQDGDVHLLKHVDPLDCILYGQCVRCSDDYRTCWMSAREIRGALPAHPGQPTIEHYLLCYTQLRISSSGRQIED